MNPIPPIEPIEPTGPTEASAARDPAEATVPAAPAVPVLSALALAVIEIEQHVARAGWDAPTRVFALVRTARALAAEPALAAQLSPAVVEAAGQDAAHLISIEQEDLPAAADLEHLLAGISWPTTVDGAAVVVERIVLPPSAEADLPDDPDAALAQLMSHPERQDVRMAVGVLRDGASWCAVRTRAYDDDASVAIGETLVPGLVAALLSTLD